LQKEREEVNSTVPPEEFDRDLVLRFFWRFSVFECALKQNGFLRRCRNEAAEPDWERFAKMAGGRFASLGSSGFGDAVEDLKRYSPMRQVVRSDGQLGWERVARQQNDSDEAYTLRLLKTARNNLFHGGKYLDGQVEEIARDRDILRAALTILGACAEILARITESANQVK
jgi:hypothetical protein